MTQKITDIMDQFAREITLSRSMFTKNLRTPGVQNQPPVSGAIQWSRSLFKRVEHDAYAQPGRQVSYRAEQEPRGAALYISFAKAVMHYENELFQRWSESVEASVMHNEADHPEEDSDGNCLLLPPGPEEADQRDGTWTGWVQIIPRPRSTSRSRRRNTTPMSRDQCSRRHTDQSSLTRSKRAPEEGRPR